MAETFFAGICGRNNPRPCKIVWSSILYPDKVGIYPANLLPSKRTIWYASNGGGYNFTPPATQSGDVIGIGSGVGGLILGGLSGSGLFGSDISFDTFRPQTHLAFIFARTANRLNIPYVLKQSDISSINTDRSSPEFGIGTIDVGEYIFQAIAVTDTEEEINNKLTDEEIDAIEGTDQNQSDREFRKLFELTFEDNRLIGVDRNKLGIEYRLDNGSSKADSVMSIPGSGDQRNAGYRDGSSRVIKVDLRTIIGATTQQGNTEQEVLFLVPGNIIYLTYVAIKEHYMRQVVLVSWQFTAQDIPPQCYPAFPTIRAANFRFKEWQVDGTVIPGKPAPLPVTLGGWRVVETFNMRMNIQALVGSSNKEIANFLIGDRSGLSTFQYLPGKLTDTQLKNYIDNPGTLPSYEMNLNKNVDGHYYSPVRNTAYTKSNWYLTNGSNVNQSRYDRITRHVYYNVHSKALNKRDVDKFGIERFLAETVLQDIDSGKLTFYPFMDDSNFNDPDNPLTFLDNTNTLFEPIQPPSSSFFADMQCGVAGSFVLRTGSEFGDVLSEYQITSPIISEVFAKDTRVLIERHFTTGNRGERIVAVEGLAGLVSSVSTVSEPSKKFSLALHSDNSGYLTFNKFSDNKMLSDLGSVSYRPDKGNPPVEDNGNPLANQYEEVVGYSGMLGDYLGHYPGEKVTFSQLSKSSLFIYKVNNKSIARSMGANDNDIEEINYSISDGKLTIDLGRGWYGVTEILYEYNRNLNFISTTFMSILKIKSGSDIVSTVDSIAITEGLKSEQKQILNISHKWFEGTSIELDIPVSGFKIHSVLVIQLKDNFADDFLTDTNSSSSSSINLINKADGLPVFIETSTMSGCFSNTGIIYIFFDDKDGNISCAESDDEGYTWYFHYGIVQSVNEIKAQYPFAISGKEQNVVFLFYFFGGKIMVKRINCGELLIDDALLIERYSEDIFVPPTETENPKENKSVYTPEGFSTRYRSISYVASGDLNDAEFLTLTGRNLELNTFEPTRKVDIITGEATGRTSVEAAVLRTSVISIGSFTAFANKDHGDHFFSVYRRDNGEMCLFFLAPTNAISGGGSQLQCHFSADDGLNWYDKWEYNEYGHNRFRSDSTRHTQFLDLSAAGTTPSSIYATDPQLSEQDAPFGINVHWSRLKKHKIEGGDTLNSESQVITIDAPYLFYLPLTKTAFLFYIYEECLLCKMFGDEIFDYTMDDVKKLIEENSRANFVDGNLESDDLREEIHRYYNSTTNEIMAEGNIVFSPQYAIDTFDETRSISPQRVSAYELPNGSVRVLYKNKSGRLKAALWTGNNWFQEDLLNGEESTVQTQTKIPSNAKEVKGGFSGSGFTGG